MPENLSFSSIKSQPEKFGISSHPYFYILQLKFQAYLISEKKFMIKKKTLDQFEKLKNHKKKQKLIFPINPVRT